MEVENQNTVTPSCPSQEGSSSSNPDEPSPQNYSDDLTHHSSYHGSVFSNRIFVGGFGYMVNERDLHHFFSQHGAVKQVKIVIDRSGVSKGYGFVTFETQEVAHKILHDANPIYFKDKKLSIGKAFRRRLPSRHSHSFHMSHPDAAVPLPMTPVTLCSTTSRHAPFTYHSAVTCFHCPNMWSPAQHWPPAQHELPNYHVYQQPANHYYQGFPNQYQWTVTQMPMTSSPVMYSQQPEYQYVPADGGSVPPPPAVMENITSEIHHNEYLTFPYSEVHQKPEFY